MGWEDDAEEDEEVEVFGLNYAWAIRLFVAKLLVFLPIIVLSKLFRDLIQKYRHDIMIVMFLMPWREYCPNYKSFQDILQWF